MFLHLVWKKKLFSNMDVANVPYFENIGLSHYLLHLHINCVYFNKQWWLFSQEHFSNLWHSLISSIFVAYIKYVLEAMSGSCLGMWPLTSRNLSKCSNIGDKYHSINHWEKFPSAFQEHFICMNISFRPSYKKDGILHLLLIRVGAILYLFERSNKCKIPFIF